MTLSIDSPRESTRLRKGDMKVDVKNDEGRISVYLDRDRVKPEKRARLNDRLGYLQYLAITVSGEEWPMSHADYLALVERNKQERQNAAR